MIKQTIVLICTLSTLTHAQQPQYVITNSAPTHSRIGDLLTPIIKALWVSHIHDIPFHHRPVAYTPDINIKSVPVCNLNRFKLRPLTSQTQLDHAALSAFQISYEYGTNTWGPIKPNNEWQHFKAMMNDMKSDESFIAKLRYLLAPVNKPIKHIPDGVVSVAVHMRTGFQFSGDTNSVVESLTMRFIDDAYYIWGLQQICLLFPEHTIYARIFTDDANFAPRAERMSNELQDYPVILTYRHNDNRHDAHVVEDLWAMTYYDCLIRPWSQYSFYAELLGDHKVVIFPEEQLQTHKKIGIKNSDGTITYQICNF